MSPAAAWQPPPAAAPPAASAWLHAMLADADLAASTPAGSSVDDSDASEFMPGDTGFIALCQAYRASGGIARGEDLAHWMLGRGQGDSLHLATLIVGGQAFSLEWRQTFWVPMFQFSPLQPAWGLGARDVLAELGKVLDGWQLAAWFVRGNTWLAGARPLDLLAGKLPLVLAAARADRYVAKG